jgi:protein-tyrosine phosphatase/predicted NAD-dependent protein-ADP-ribosyltransferase YbiA (DUF1768 family)
MENASYFIKDVGLFGGYPTQEQVYDLETKGVRWFVNLTNSDEKHIRKYNTKYGYIHYPIPDMYIPRDGAAFATFLTSVSKVIRKCSESGDKIFIHCKGGHGRSGVVVACLLIYMKNMNVYEALSSTRYYHSQRPNLKDKWLKIGSPQTKTQKNFVKRFFETYYIKRNHPFSTYSSYKVSIPEIGTFHTAEAAYQALKDPNDKQYIELLLSTINPSTATRIGNSKDVVWDHDYHLDILNTVLCYKLKTNPRIKPILLNTGMCYLVDKRPISYMGKGLVKEDCNIYGKLLMEYRHSQYDKNSFLLFHDLKNISTTVNDG